MSLATPLAHGASPGPLNNGPNASPDLDRTTWQREMERAMSAAWFRFDDAAAASLPESRAQPASAASMPPSRVRPAPVASARADAKSRAMPKDATTARNDDGADAEPALAAAAPGTLVHLQIAAPARGTLASDGAMPVTDETLPASAAAFAPPALSPNAPGPMPIAPAALAQPLAAALIAALVMSPQGAASGSTTEEPAPPAPPPAPAEEIPPALRDLFGPLPGEIIDAAPSAEIGEASAPAAAREEPNAEPAPPLRWHAEWDEQGVRVWLGLDCAAGIDAPQLAQQVLQSLGAQGVRVLALVCNGKTLYGAAAPRDSNPQSNRRDA